MKKEIIILNKIFIFQFIEENKIWYLGKEEIDLFDNDNKIDVSINRENANWEYVEKFLKYIIENKETVQQNIIKVNNVLKCFHKELYNHISPSFNYIDIYFNLCNIQYNGYIITSSELSFTYELSFFLESSSDPNVFSYESWNAQFVNHQFEGISKS